MRITKEAIFNKYFLAQNSIKRKLLLRVFLRFFDFAKTKVGGSAVRLAFGHEGTRLSRDKEAVLKRLCEELSKRGPVRVIEIGVWFGNGSTKIFLENLPEGSTLGSVDKYIPYHPDANSDLWLMNQMLGLANSAANSYFEDYYNPKIDRDLKGNFDGVGFQPRVDWVLIRGSSETSLQLLLDNSKDVSPEEATKEEGFDCIFLDGSHYVDAVRNEIRLAKTLLKSCKANCANICSHEESGILCGDDLEIKPNPSNYEKALSEKNLDFVNGYHPGVLIATYENLEEIHIYSGMWFNRSI